MTVSAVLTKVANGNPLDSDQAAVNADLNTLILANQQQLSVFFDGASIPPSSEERGLVRGTPDYFRIVSPHPLPHPVPDFLFAHNHSCDLATDAYTVPAYAHVPACTRARTNACRLSPCRS